MDQKEYWGCESHLADQHREAMLWEKQGEAKRKQTRSRKVEIPKGSRDWEANEKQWKDTVQKQSGPLIAEVFLVGAHGGRLPMNS